MDGISEIIKSKVKEYGINEAQKLLVSAFDEHKIKESLKTFVNESNSETLSKDEEIDYQGFEDYILGDFIEDAKTLYCSINEKERESAQKRIKERTIYRSNANTKSAADRVEKLTQKALVIIKNHFGDKLTENEKYVTGIVIDKLDSKGNQIIEHIDEVVLNLQKTNPNNSIETVRNHASKGDFDFVEKEFQIMEDAISLEHPLRPDYCYKYIDEKVHSVPKTENATKKYPPKFVCECEVSLGQKRVDTLDASLCESADRHQEPIIVAIKKSKKYLGNIEDPVQHEADDMVGKMFVRIPKPFPPAFPCDIKIGNETFLKRVMFRTEEILDDETCIISNKEELNSPYYIRIEANFIEKTIKFSMSLKKANNKEYLTYVRMMFHATKGEEIEVYSCELKSLIVRGKTEDVEYKTGFDSIEEEIDFLERICDIEEYLQTEIIIPESIYLNDYELVHYLSDLVRGTINNQKCENFRLPCEVTQELRQYVKEIVEEIISLELLISYKVILFEKEHFVKVLRTIEHVQLADKDILIKLNYMKDGEIIFLDYTPGIGSTYGEIIQ